MSSLKRHLLKVFNVCYGKTMENGIKAYKPLQNQNEDTILLFNRNKLPLSKKLAFALGHVYNDICAALWFTYSLIFLQLVIQYGPTQAGAFLLLGQTVDAVFTPISGYILDRTGERKKWHFYGSVLVVVSFPMIFTSCSALGTPWMQASVFAMAITIFQIGWALVQISHLSMLTELTPLPEERATLTAYRYTASMVSHILVYFMVWIFLNSGQAMNAELIGPNDAWRFLDTVLVMSGIGIISTAIFHIILARHRWEVIENKERGKSTREYVKAKVSKLFRSPQLYKIAITYTASRLFMTLSLEYIPLFINETVVSDPGTLATVPLASFVVSAFVSPIVKHTRLLWGNKATYTFGCVLCLTGCFIVQHTNERTDDATLIFCIAMLFGAGSAITTVISLCLTANFIGGDTQCGAFVYSSVTFADKLINGLAVVTIEYMKCNEKELCPFYYGNVLSFVNGTISIIGLFVLLTLPGELFTGLYSHDITL
uniref:Major facilitator superfamily (MFS) profile domain-containing protein n=2 Tax=Clastoptera arizonana TaxID=38151 RepID=A0A1B6DK64_9HEMI